MAMIGISRQQIFQTFFHQSHVHHKTPTARATLPYSHREEDNTQLSSRSTDEHLVGKNPQYGHDWHF
jgi:hypothetical protein